MTECPPPVLTSGFFRQSMVVFNRQLRMNLRNPAWVLIGVPVYVRFLSIKHV